MDNTAVVAFHADEKGAQLRCHSVFVTGALSVSSEHKPMGAFADVLGHQFAIGLKSSGCYDDRLARNRFCAGSCPNSYASYRTIRKGNVVGSGLVENGYFGFPDRLTKRAPTCSFSTTLSALPGLEVGNVQRIPSRLKLALARFELRMVIFVSSLSASPSDTFMMSAKYFSSGYSLDTRLKAPPQKAVLPWGKLDCDFSTMITLAHRLRAASAARQPAIPSPMTSTSTIFFGFDMRIPERVFI